MRKIIALVGLLLFTLSALAQDYTISGNVVDKTSKTPLSLVTVRVMKTDSSYVGGASSKQTGAFSVNAKKAGSYILKFSYIGYLPIFKNVTLTKESPSANLGTVTMESNDIIMKAATVKARIAKMEMRKDTFVYNVAAYRVPEGATLEALIDQLPGAVVDDNGGITINGKTVSEILVDGKDFFKGDKQVAMKNLPVSLIERVKAYDMQSDYTKQTGIDDGNEKTVLDLEMKKKLKSTWFSNIDLAYGNHDRYSSNMFVNRFTDNTRISMYGSMNNVGDRRFRGGGPGFRGGSNGLSANKSFGMDAFWNNGKKEREAGRLEIGGNFRLNHGNSESLSRSNSETFLNTTSTSSSFNNNVNHSYGKNSRFNVEGRLEWNPDTMTSVNFRPEFSHNESNNSSTSKSATFNSNPYDYAENPLDSMFYSNSAINVPTTLSAIAVNRNTRESMGSSHSNNLDVEFGINRRLNSKGRNIGLNGGIDYSKSDNESFNLSDIYYYQRRIKNEVYNNQFTTSPSKSWRYNVRLSYSEPLAKNLFAEASYNFSYRYSNSDRSLFQLDSLAGWGLGNTHAFGMLPQGDSIYLARNIENSRYSTYKDYDQDINIGLRYVTEDFNISAGVRMEPEYTKLDYQKHQLDTIVTRHVFNVAPNIRLRYNIDKRTRLELRYRGSSSQPSMTDLLDVTDNSDPLYISKGNPGLKPSWTNNFNFHYNTYIEKRQQSIAADGDFSQTSNSISSAMTYDETTGVRTTRPENINGNWDAYLWAMYNTSFGPDNMFFISNSPNANYRHNVGYMSTGNASSEKNTMKTLSIGDRLRATYRNDYFEFGLNGSFDYSHSRSSLRTQSNLDTWTFAYGGSLQFNSTWNMTISTDIAMNSRRGYTDSSMNTNELIWNAQISQSFLDQNAATISLQLYDILHQQSNISRTINAMSRSDRWTNGINSYFMVHFIYRLNIFGGMGGRIRPGGGNSDNNRERNQRSGGNRGGGNGGGGNRGGGRMG